MNDIEKWNAEQEEIQRQKCEDRDVACKDTSVNDDSLSPLGKRIERRYQTQKDTQQRLKMKGINRR